MTPSTYTDKKRSIIELRNVDKVFWSKTESIHVLKNVSVEIPQGSFTILFGPSGCGKSTMLHVLLGLEEPTRGKVFFMGKDFYSLKVDDRSDIRKRTVGMVYQQSNWIKSLNVIENIAFPLSLIGYDTDESLRIAREKLQLVGMQNWATYSPSELSSGQQQKIALARALTTDPQIIVADEPTGNLDYQSGVDLMNLFKKLNQEGKTIVMVTHDLGFISFATTIINIFDGRIVKVIDTRKDGIDLLQEAVRNKVIDPGSLDRKTAAGVTTPALAELRPVKKGMLKELPGHIKNTILMVLMNTVKSLIFIGILALHMITKLPGLSQLRYRIGRILHSSSMNIHRGYLIDLSLKNFRTRKIRTFITIGGMAIGIGAVVFLVSIGYGLESVVITRVAKFEETKQVDTTPAVASNVKITDTTLQNFKNFEEVETVLPLIGVVGKINYQNSNTDVAVYGIKPEYLSRSALIPTSGQVLTGNNSLKDDKVSVTEPKNETPAVDNTELDFTTPAVTEKVRLYTIEQKDVREAVVNKSFIQVFGMSDLEAVGKEFMLSYTITPDLSSEQYKALSTPIKYRISGVLPDAQSPIVYTLIDDVKQLKADYYSQIKVVAKDTSVIPDLRKKIEVSGFKTASVLDTINQIQQLFSTVRIIFGIVGLVALAVASLGMFNTLTISLLERTHEVGLMKAIGMKSFEVQDLFLTESMIMGICGGLGGLMGGYLAGKGLSVLVSAFAVSDELGFIDISLIPTSFVITIIILSLIVGVVTGIYPAYRSSNISALNALRYE
jgi:ABC-type lipoprotein export system ATPase subunit/ABC-type antimicrobial peptide transport system permease subunit